MGVAGQALTISDAGLVLVLGRLVDKGFILITVEDEVLIGIHGYFFSAIIVAFVYVHLLSSCTQVDVAGVRPR